MASCTADYQRFVPMAARGVAPEKPSGQLGSSTLCVGDAVISSFDLDLIAASLEELRKTLITAFGDGLRDVGFVAIKAAALTPLIARVNALMRKYFDQPLSKKMEDDHHNNFQTGYWPQGFETAAGASQPDNKETYFIPPKYDRWPVFENPEDSREFQEVMAEYHSILTGYAARCMSLIAEYLGEPTEEVTQSVTSAHNLLRLAHYFATTSDAPRAGAHYDLNCITLLPPATGPGLQLRDKMGVWKAVSVAEGYLIVNTGEQLEKKTAGMIKATLHRVVKPEGEEAARRLASIFFASWSTGFSLKPFRSCVVEQTWEMSLEEKGAYLKQYPDVTVMENLLSRLIEMGSILDPKEELVRELHAKGLLRQPPAALKAQYPDLFTDT